MNVKTNYRLVKRAFEIANMGCQLINKRIFLELMKEATTSVEEIEATIGYLSSPSKGLFTVNNNEICLNTVMLGCSKCKHVIMANGWRIQSNKCGLTNILLDRDISKAGICEEFCPLYLETELKNPFWSEK